MSNIPKFNATHREFIHAALLAGAGIGKIIDDLMEIYPDFRAIDSNIRNKLSDRITKIKARLPETEKKAEWETIPHYLSADWRLTYFRALLGETEDMSMKIRLLGEIRKEVTIIDNHNKDREPTRKEAYNNKRRKEKDLHNWYDPNHLAYEDISIKYEYCHPDTDLPIKSYRQTDEGVYIRKSDGVAFNRQGTPVKAGEKTHTEWIEEQKQRGIYIYDPKVEAEVIPSPLVLDKDHRDAYDNACRNGWIFKNSLLPKKAYKKIDYSNYRRLCDGVAVDKIGIPLKAGEKDHHTWLYEQEGIYNYDPKASTQTIANVLATQESTESKQA